MTTTLTTPSPTLSPQPSFRAAARPLTTTLQLRRPLSPAVIAAAQSAAPGATSLSTSLIELTVPASASSPHQVDVGTQYSPPGYPPTAPWPTSSTEQPSPPTARRAHRDRPMNKRREPEEVKEPPKPSLRLDPSSLSPGPAVSPALPADSSAAGASQSKRPRPNAPMAKELPHTYADCDVADLGVLIADMLMDLVDINDKIPLVNGSLTRFHSRAPPAISVNDYLSRLIVHATLSQAILLSMVYYIDRLCALYPGFTISSLTVHRFLIAAATVAAKGLSDSFWTNNTYARVGGVSIRELALLELDFLEKMDWRIVPQPEVLDDYYRSLVERNQKYQFAD